MTLPVIKGMAKKKPFTLPQSILTQLSEMSNGGFVLLRIKEDGTPDVHLQADSPMQAYFLQSFLLTWSQAMQNANIEMMTGQMLGEDEEDNSEF